MANIENILINVGLYITYGLVAIALICLLYFAVRQFISNIRQSQKGIVAMVGVLVLFAVSYLISSPSDISEVLFDKTGTSYGSSQLIGSGLILTYFLFAAVIVTLITVEILRPLKK